MTDAEYRFTVRPLSGEQGGGFLIEFPDLLGCIGDGETIEDAIASGRGCEALAFLTSRVR